MLQEKILHSYQHSRLDVASFLSFFETYLEDSLQSLDEPTINLARHVVLSRGKRIRPLLCFHTGAKNPLVTNDLLKASTILELVHVATLVHDDIIDGASLRRGTETVHSFAGHHSAILLGDALFSYALELATEFHTNYVCKVVSRATRLTCSGEINQTSRRGDFSLTLSEYYSMIQDKTGELFKASCQLGAMLAGHSEKDIDIVGEFGVSIGTCYQIYDDLIDTFGSRLDETKSLGSDFESGKLTLPLLILLQELEEKKRCSLIEAIRNASSAESKEFVHSLFKANNIMPKCLNELQRHADNINLLANSVSDSVLSKNLNGFLSLFSGKLTKLNLLETSNFLDLPA